jgi:hypothetical protein
MSSSIFISYLLLRSKARIHFYFISSAFDYDSNSIVEFTDFVVCFSITSFGNIEEKIKLAFKIYDLGLILSRYTLLF